MITTGVGASSIAGSAPPAGVDNPNGTLGQNDFLKLMIAQLQAQDPLQPANGTEYISELAQFTQVEQMTNLANANELAGAVQLIGRTVSYADGSGGRITGKVQSIQSDATGTSITVEGIGGIKLTSILEVE
jgi:flagellar basal-body rod modification protein FlgD